MSSRTLVIEVIACETTAAALQGYLNADPRADIVELRLDLIRDLDLDSLLGARGKPKLLTIRSVHQGGAAVPAEREALLRRAHASLAEFLDLELGDEELPFLENPGGPRRILSFHDPETTPFDLPALETRMRRVPHVAYHKIVTFADVATDNLRIRDLLRTSREGDLIAFCMGPKGVPSRILASRWGSAAIYAPRRGAAPSAPGQVPLEDLIDLYRFHQIRKETRLLGVVGHPVGHSLSPLMHNKALAALDLDYRYLPFDVSVLAEFLPLMSELPITGLSVTLPHKERLVPYLDRLDTSARRAGAVNTVRKVWNRLEGYNTDVAAALAPLRGRMRLRNARVAVLGAGGAARALVEGLTRRGARVTVFNRTAERARELALRFGVRHLPWRRARRFRCDLLINATSVGMAPNTEKTPVPISWVAAPLVYDIIYIPRETKLLCQARKRGLTSIGGVEMFVAQGAAQFELFTGHAAPRQVMRRAVLDALEMPAELPTSPERSRPPAARRAGRTRRPVDGRPSARKAPGVRRAAMKVLAGARRATGRRGPAARRASARKGSRARR